MGYQEEKQRQLDKRYLRMARIWAENSYCVRRKVGALIVKDQMIISDGYNGTPSGFENICEDEAGARSPTCCTPRPTPSPRWPSRPTTATARRSTSPPRPASSAQSSSSRRHPRVVYAEDYRSEEGLDLLRRVGIECVQTDEN